MVWMHGRDSHAWEKMLDYSIRGHLAPSISHELYSWTDRRGIQHGIRAIRSWVQALITHISLRIITPAYKSSYGGACVAQTSKFTCPSGEVGPGWYAGGGMLESDKRAISSLLYHMSFMVWLIDGVFYHDIQAIRSRVWTPATHIFVARNSRLQKFIRWDSRLQKFIRWGLRSTD
jgi:hypothetical protein